MSSKKTSEELNKEINEARKKLHYWNQSVRWRHYKGGLYSVQDVVVDTNDGSLRVMYYRIGGPDYNEVEEQDISYVRPLDEWFDAIVIGPNDLCRRFTPVKEENVWVEVESE